MNRRLRLLICISMVTALAIALPSVAVADSSATIDFEGLAEGAIVNSVSSGLGISGDPIPGSVGVVGVSGNPAITTNASIIFDANCDGLPSSCTGDDGDLYFPGQGKVLIIAENLVDANNDGLVDDPDDADLAGATHTFDFTTFGPGQVTVESLWVGDIGDSAAEGGVVELYSGATLLASIPLPLLANNQATTLNIGVSGVTSMVVVLRGSGAIDDIKISVEEPEGGTQGCTPGYWKNHLDSWAVTGYAPTQTLESVFDVPDGLGYDNVTLHQALSFSGGSGVSGASRILLRAAVASLLNSAHPDVDFTMSTSDVIAAVNAALANNDRATILDLASSLDTDNNLGCPLN